MVPVVHGLEKKYHDQIAFVFLNMDNPNTYEFQDVLGVYYRPEFYLLGANGDVLQKFVGYTSQEKFEAEFIKYIK